jgi:antitoxin component YwqK of YwqJK toxin-antitoxin module
MRALLACLVGLTLLTPLACATQQAPVPEPPVSAPASVGSADPDPDANSDGDPPPDLTAGLPDYDPDPYDPNDISHTQAAVESAMLGAIIGSSAGPIGMAVGGVALLIYGAITGDVPLDSSPGGGGGGGGRGSDAAQEAELEREIESELARQDALEAEIEAELKRQEDLLRQIQQDETLREEESVPEGDSLEERADPRSAPLAPKERDLPATIFDEESRTIPPDTWGNSERIPVLVRSLDADRDGAPEETRYHDQTTGVIVRKEEDRSYDGQVDAWITYDAGMVSEVVLDNSGDGKPDEWQVFGPDGRMASRQVDRNSDGVRDAFFSYEDGSLIGERHDSNGDGEPDRVVYYTNRQLDRAEEDRDQDGSFDTWTHYESRGGEEQIVRVERDTTGDGRPDTFETYEQVAGKPALTLREEDKNGDGTIDIKSIYEDGKLKQREISDPALMPL